MSILRLYARDESQPRGRDRVCIVRQVGERFAGNLELMISTRPRTDLPLARSLARVPECLIRLRGRQKSVCGDVHV